MIDIIIAFEVVRCERIAQIIAALWFTFVEDDGVVPDDLGCISIRNQRGGIFDDYGAYASHVG